MIEKKINLNYDNLSKTEKKLAEWFKNYSWTHLSIKEICRISNFSLSTINRLSKKLGYKGFSEMKALINFQTNNYSNEPHANDLFLKDIIYSFEENTKKVDLKEIEFLSKKIHEKRKVYFYGESFTHIISEYIARKFSKINYETKVINVSSDLSLIIPKKDAVHIFVSNSGKNPNIQKGCEKIYSQKNKQFIATLTSTNYSNIAKYSNVCISGTYYSSIDQDDFELPFIAQYITQYNLDLVFNFVYKYDIEKNKKIIKSISKMKY